MYCGENMKNLVCPKCKSKLTIKDRTLSCKNFHSFDFAKEGYVNLLLGNKNGSLMGDNRDMAVSRRDFLNKGYFLSLAQALDNEIKALSAKNLRVLDICCGEGYYSSFLSQQNSGEFYGFDLSKEMVRLAAKRKSEVNYFVANMTDIPIEDESIDFAFHLFAPFYEKEFYRVLKKDGMLISVTPGKKHLFSLKEALYDTPYENDETPPETSELHFIEQKKIKSEIHLESNEDILALFKMTPYYYHTSDKNKKRLDNIDSLTTEVEFCLNIYSRR